jgi:hypothetical protein
MIYLDPAFVFVIQLRGWEADSGGFDITFNETE